MPRHITASWLITAAVLSFGIGAATTLAISSDDHPGSGDAPDPGVSSAICPDLEISPEQLAAATALAALLANTTVAEGLEPTEPAMFSEMIDKARIDPVSRRELFDTYRTAPPGDAKRMLRGVLMSLQTADASDFFIELAGSDDPEKRRDGLEILRITGRKIGEVRQVAMRALATEQDPLILSDAIGALHPGIAAESESTAILQQLRSFAEHSDPQVRAQSVRGMVSWDKTGETLPVLQRALADAAPEVRSAAVLSIMENHVRTDDLKQALIRIANAPGENPGLRTNAVIALEHYALSNEEYSRILQSAMEADALMDSQLAAAQ